MPEITPLEAAEKLEKRMKRYHPSDAITAASRLAVDSLRAIAAGEYKQVIHARWVKKYDTLSQDYNSDNNWLYVCSNCGCIDRAACEYCHCCGALMDAPRDGNSHIGKEESI